MTCSPLASRRRAILGLAAPLLLSFAPDPADARTRTRRSARHSKAAGADVLPPERTLTLYHQHTGERLRAVYYADGGYQPETLHALDRLLRDWHQDRTRPTDPRLLDLVWLLHRRLEGDVPVEVLCGYRTPETNAMLRRTSEGVARNSLHMKAMAIDLRVPGRSLKAVHGAALALRWGGVGYYPQHGFVHVDTGPVRHWQFGA